MFPPVPWCSRQILDLCPTCSLVFPPVPWCSYRILVLFLPVLRCSSLVPVCARDARNRLGTPKNTEEQTRNTRRHTGTERNTKEHLFALVSAHLVCKKKVVLDGIRTRDISTGKYFEKKVALDGIRTRDISTRTWCQVMLVMMESRDDGVTCGVM